MLTRIGVFIVCFVVANAACWAANVTIPDENVYSSPGWYGSQEDQEVEYNSVTSQLFDMEGFYLSGTTLTMVGGYNYVRGAAGLVGSLPGDIFIDVDGNAQYGSGAHAPTAYAPYTTTSDTFGYDFVLDLNFQSMSYTVYDINSANINLQTTSEYTGASSNPWQYLSGGTQVTSGTIGYTAGLSDTSAQGMGFDVTGGNHYLASFDLDWLVPYSTGDFTMHYTMERGNDLLMGMSEFIVPEPTTLSLLGIGLASVLIRRRFQRG